MRSRHSLRLWLTLLCVATPQALTQPQGLPQAGPRTRQHPAITAWLTTPDRSALLSRQPQPLQFNPSTPADDSLPVIRIDDTHPLQSIDGFGFALTGGSAQLMMRMSAAGRSALIRELFTRDGSHIGVSYLRLSIGSSDMNDHVFTYDDMPAGTEDQRLQHFSLGEDRADVLPALKEILAVAPNIGILASPWSAPAWMKSNGAMKGGSLKPADYDVYARYLVRYVEAMQAEGVRIDALTMQNEPLNTNNTPSMKMTAPEQADFLEHSLGPLLRLHAPRVKVILYDHNCDLPQYPLSILADPGAAQYADGSGFHLYGGHIDALTTVHNAYPGRNIYFTEQMVIDQPGAKTLAIAAPERRVVIGALQNWSRLVLLWNLAADANNEPHTPDGGCPVCEGAVTLEDDQVTRNLAYYTLAHASKFVPPGSVRLRSSVAGPASAANPSDPESIAQVAFRTPDGGYALIVANSSGAQQGFQIEFEGQTVVTSLPPGAVATYTW
jgi:glucosylceramidase